jgi:predicted MFS family arabinose efflux permease
MRASDPRKHPFMNRIPFLILLGGTAKLLVDTTVQIFNPFLFVIASGLGIGTVSMGRIVALRSLTGLTAPFIGHLADRIGHRTVMRASLFTVGIAMILAPASGSLLVFAAAVALTGAGQSGYTPNLHAYLSSKLPYEKRATGLGIIEYSWALAGILGLLASGFLMEAYSWKAPFYVLGAGLLIMSFVSGLLPVEDVRGEHVRRRTGTLRSVFSLGEHAASAWAAIGVAGLNMFSMMHVMIAHGAWLQAEYALRPSRLGSVAMILGFCDLTASVLVSVFVDRIGKRKSVLIGVTGMVAGFAVLPFLNGDLVRAVASIAIPRICFEFAVVSNFPLLSEQAPHARGRVMSLGMTAGLIGTSVAGLTGPAAYLRYGVWGLGPVSCAAAVVSLLILVFLVRERPYSMTA